MTEKENLTALKEKLFLQNRIFTKFAKKSQIASK